MIAGVATVALVTVVVLVTGLTAFVFADDLIVAVQHLDLILGGAVVPTDRRPVPSDGARFCGGRRTGGNWWFGVCIDDWATITTVGGIGIVLHTTFATGTDVVWIDSLTLRVTDATTVTFIGTGSAADIAVEATFTTGTNVSGVRSLTLCVRGTRTVTRIGGGSGCRDGSWD